ncbi:MAG: YicC/YloC family endoribonuclease [Maritimibacter sp.]
MTGFSNLAGALGPWRWTWDLRAVNAKGLDIRLRVPDWIEGLEPFVRKSIGERVARGSVSLSLRITRETETDGQLSVNSAALSASLEILGEIQAAAGARGLPLRAMSAAEVAMMRGVLDTKQSEDDTAPLLAALKAELPTLLKAFNDMRTHEGAAMQAVLGAQLQEITALVDAAKGTLEARSIAQSDTLKGALQRVVENVDGADPDRVAQELAMITVKSDVREEIDRLEAHVDQAQSLLNAQEPSGRKLDFLMQEFNREANTLCAKAGYKPLTAIGLDLKAVIDQMREQVQNIE